MKKILVALVSVVIIMLVLTGAVLGAELLKQRVFEQDFTIMVNPPPEADIQGRIISQTSESHRLRRITRWPAINIYTRSRD